MTRPRTVLMLLGGAAAAAVVARHLRGPGMGHRVPGGILVGDAGIYDLLSRRLLGSYYRGIADDVASVIPDGARVLEVGCGPGHLSSQLAFHHDLDVTGLDLDPAMIERARVNAQRAWDGKGGGPSFDVGDVASLPYPDRSFDLVVSTLSMHHWADPAAGLSEIARVLRPGGRALIWDLGSGFRSLHGHVPDPAQHLHGSPLRPVSVTPWRWPWNFAPTQRMELVGHSQADEGLEASIRQ